MPVTWHTQISYLRTVLLERSHQGFQKAKVAKAKAKVFRIKYIYRAKLEFPETLFWGRGWDGREVGGRANNHETLKFSDGMTTYSYVHCTCKQLSAVMDGINLVISLVSEQFIEKTTEIQAVPEQDW